MTDLAPPVSPAADLLPLLRGPGFAVLDAAEHAALAGCTLADWQAWLPEWEALPHDTWLRDGGRYRRRRHSCFIVTPGPTSGPALDPTPGACRVERTPHRPHWQPVEYNALHGGLERLFEPMPEPWTDSPAWTGLLCAWARVAEGLRPGTGRWFVEAHPFRIDCADGIGRPTPEGAHRDGVDLVVVVLVGRRGIVGGETRVFEATSPHGMRFTLREPFSALVMDDVRVIHESTPIQPDPAAAEREPCRDTLVLTFRAGGFQGPA